MQKNNVVLNMAIAFLIFVVGSIFGFSVARYFLEVSLSEYAFEIALGLYLLISFVSYILIYEFSKILIGNIIQKNMAGDIDKDDAKAVFLFSSNLFRGTVAFVWPGTALVLLAIILISMRHGITYDIDEDADGGDEDE